MWEYIIKGLIGLLLIIAAIQDIRWKKIKVGTVLTAAIIICFCVLFCSKPSVLDSLLGAALGLGVVLLSKITGGKIGVGDGLVLGITGIGLGFWSNIELFALALFMAAVFSIGLLCFSQGRQERKRFPLCHFFSRHICC